MSEIIQLILSVEILANAFVLFLVALILSYAVYKVFER